MRKNDSPLKFIFVHGLSGWGSYDQAYQRMPYWGMRGGDLIAYLRQRGFDCYAASVAPTGSAWDRACELYAQLAGVRVDYGKAHSARCGHARYGRDFSGCPLIGDWQSGTRLVLLGHSFGGATVRLFAELLAHGDAKERLASDGETLSPLFAGGQGDRAHSVVTLASPMNGTTAYDMGTDAAFDWSGLRTPWWSRLLARLMSVGTKPQRDGRNENDYADYDMHIDHALQLNQRMQEQPGVYYYAVPCSSTVRQADGTWRPDASRMEPLFVLRSIQIGMYAGVTRGGVVIDEGWRENDGLVNTCSAAYPMGAPHTPLDVDNIRPGVWNVLPTFAGDHMALQGGLMRKRDVRDFYEKLLTLIGQQ